MDAKERQQRAAEVLRDAQRTGIPCKPVSSEFGVTNDDAYEVQRINMARRLADGASRVGWKVGLTSDAIQSWLGVSEPDYGMLLDDMVVVDGGVCSTTGLLQPRAETEIAYVLGRDIDDRVTPTEILGATDYLLPAIEIIDSRVADWKITWADTVSDNASSGMFVCGSTPVPVEARDLRLAGMVMRKNGRVVSTGAGAACLGHPLNAVTWLANKLVEHGESLAAGDIILSGALGPVADIAEGDFVSAEIAGLGGVSCRFG